jgi:hypothetical protein
MHVIAFTGFVVIAQHTFASYNIGEPVFKLMNTPSQCFGRCHNTNSANADSEYIMRVLMSSTTFMLDIVTTFYGVVNYSKKL